MSFIPEAVLRQILAPVSEQSPCGDSKESILNTDSPATDAIVELDMKYDQSTKVEKQGEKLELKKQVFELSSKILGSHCKHAQFLVQWLDSVPNLFDFQGLAQALDLVAKVIETFPKDLHPNPEGRATRKLEIISKLAASNSFNESVQRIPFPRDSEKEREVSFLHSVFANHYKNAPESERDSYRDLGYCSPDELSLQLATISSENCKTLLASLQSCIDATLRLDQVLSQQAKEAESLGSGREDIVGFMQLKRNLEAIVKFVKDELPNAKEPTSTEVSSEQSADSTRDSSRGLDQNITNFTLGSSVQGTLESRRAALTQLAKLAEFFRKTEPHSPISYSLQQAIRWADLSLPELIEELVPVNAREEVRLRVGAPPPETSNS